MSTLSLLFIKKQPTMNQHMVQQPAEGNWPEVFSFHQKECCSNSCLTHELHHGRYHLFILACAFEARWDAALQADFPLGGCGRKIRKSDCLKTRDQAVADAIQDAELYIHTYETIHTTTVPKVVKSGVSAWKQVRQFQLFEP